MGLRFSDKCNATRYLNILLKAAADNPGKFNVYTHETMPQRYHFTNNDRIAPIYVVPNVGYALTTREENGSGMSKGVSSCQKFDLVDLCSDSNRTTDMTTTSLRCTPYL